MDKPQVPTPKSFLGRAGFVDCVYHLLTDLTCDWGELEYFSRVRLCSIGLGTNFESRLLIGAKQNPGAARVHGPQSEGPRKNSGAVWCSLVQFGAVWCSLAQLGAAWCSLVQLGEWRSDSDWPMELREKKFWSGLVRIGSE